MASAITHFIVISLVTNIYCIAIEVSSLTQVCFKNSSETWNNKWQFHLGTRNFLELIQNNDIIIDKSLLLKKILSPDAHKVTIITAPLKWGKSINLDMIAFFARCEFHKNGTKIERENTAAYKYFTKGELSYNNKTHIFNKPPLISKDEEFINQHLKNYIVIKVDLSETVIKDENDSISFKSFFTSFQTAIRETFNDNDFIREIIHSRRSSLTEPDEVDSCDKFLKYWEEYNDYETTEMIESIRNLCQMIQTYIPYKQCTSDEKFVLVVVDQYDKPYNDIYFDLKSNSEDEEVKQIRDFIIDFLKETFKANKHYKQGIITAIAQIQGFDDVGDTIDCIECYDTPVIDRWGYSGDTKDKNKIKEMSFTRADSLFPFYGYTRQEVLKLLQLGGLTNRYEEVENMYKGYHPSVHANISLFNPWDIMNFIKTRIIDGYWIKSQSTGDILFNLLKYYDFKLAFTALLNPDLYFAISNVTFWMAPSYAVNIISTVDLGVEKLMSMLLYTGYLTSGITPSTYSTCTIRVLIPNNEIAEFIRTQIHRHYATLLGNDLSLFTNASYHFEQFFQSEYAKSTSLEENLKILIQARNITKDLLNDLNSTDDDYGPYRPKIYIPDSKKLPLYNLVHKVLLLSQLSKKLYLGLASYGSYNIYTPQQRSLLLEKGLGCEGPFRFIEPMLTCIPVGVFPNVFAYHKNKALIVGFEYDGNVTADYILNQTFKYTSALFQKTKIYQVIKYVAINLEHGDGVKGKPTIEIKTAMKSKHQIDDLIKEFSNCPK